jgi:hypothetical protein
VAGARAVVSDDSVACAMNSTISGGGSTYCPVYYNGSVWKGG